MTITFLEVPNFLVILSPHSLDNCAHEEGDWLRREIACALTLKKNILPVLLPGFQFPQELPADIRDLPRHQAVDYSHIYFAAMISRLLENLRREARPPATASMGALNTDAGARPGGTTGVGAASYAGLKRWGLLLCYSLAVLFAASWLLKTFRPTTAPPSPEKRTAGEQPHLGAGEEAKRLLITAQNPPSSTSAINLLFPLYGVTLGRTTVEELKVLGERSRSRSGTNEPPALYVINGFSFRYRNDNVARHLILGRNSDPMPDKWREAGFDFSMSYNAWLKLFRSYGWDVRIKEAPRVEDYSGRPSFFAKICAESGGIQIELNFSYSEGTTADSSDTLYGINAYAPGEVAAPGGTEKQIADAIKNSIISKRDPTHSAMNLLFPLYGVTLGKTTKDELSNLGQIDGTAYKIRGLSFGYQKGANVAERVYLSRHSDAMPEKWRSAGFNFSLSYNAWQKLFRSYGWDVQIIQKPRVKDWGGHPSFYANMRAVSGFIKIELDFAYSTGVTADSPDTLTSLRVRDARY